jgi:hypothetical protein
MGLSGGRGAGGNTGGMRGYVMACMQPREPRWSSSGLKGKR